MIRLPPKELAVLRVLVSHPGQVVPLELLRSSAWSGIHVSDESLPRCVSSLRARLGIENCIQTIYKRGYRLLFPVHRVALAGDGPSVEQFRAMEGERRPIQTFRPFKLAILPFRALQDVHESLGVSIAEAVMLRLAQARNAAMELLAWDSVIHLTDHGLVARDVGMALGADVVLAGTVGSLPRHLRVRAEMIQVSDHVQLWLEDFLISRMTDSFNEDRAAERIEARIRSLAQTQTIATEAFEVGVTRVEASGDSAA
jgi:TolB-like protein